MGQFLDYLASVFTIGNGGKSVDVKDNNSHHVTFAEGSFSQVFGARDEQANKLNSLHQSNMKTICKYELTVLLAALIQFSLVTWPKIRLNTFDIYAPEGWQLVTLNLLPVVVQIGAICAMIDFNRPLPEGTKLTTKHSGLELDNNDYIHSLKIIILLMFACQISAWFSDLFLWSIVMIVPVWCFQLTMRLAQSEFNKHAPSPKKPWVKLNVSKSPKAIGTPNKSAHGSARKAERDHLDATKATPRTRTRRAVKSFVNGVSERYHAFEQNVAQQISSKIINPMSPRAKAIES